MTKPAESDLFGGERGAKSMNLLLAVERHLRVTAVAPSRFGREVAGDPRFVFDLRRGREPRAATRARVLAFMANTKIQSVQEIA